MLCLSSNNLFLKVQRERPLAYLHEVIHQRIDGFPKFLFRRNVVAGLGK